MLIEEKIVLLNILIALYNSSYEDIYENADEEYLALFAQKTMQFVRAPDENVYIAPFNIIEIFISGTMEWWMNKTTYEFINDCVMGFIYSPLLLVAAYFETRTAYSICRNRARGEDDDDRIEQWEQMASDFDFESDGWTKTCEMAKPNVEEEPAVIEVRKLRAEVDHLKSMLAEISKAVGASTEASTSKAAETTTEEPQEATSPSQSSGKKKRRKGRGRGSAS